MDWLGGSFCQEFTSSSSITDIVDLVESSTIQEDARGETVTQEWLVSNQIVPETLNGLKSDVTPTSQEPICSAADTTEDPSVSDALV